MARPSSTGPAPFYSPRAVASRDLASYSGSRLPRLPFSGAGAGPGTITLRRAPAGPGAGPIWPHPFRKHSHNAGNTPLLACLPQGGVSRLSQRSPRRGRCQRRVAGLASAGEAEAPIRLCGAVALR